MASDVSGSSSISFGVKESCCASSCRSVGWNASLQAAPSAQAATAAAKKPKPAKKGGEDDYDDSEDEPPKKPAAKATATPVPAAAAQVAPPTRGIAVDRCT